MKRIITSICLLFSAFLLPWWVTISIAIIGIFLFENFYEGIGAGLLLYVLYAGGSTQFLASTFWLPVALIGMYAIIQMLKRFIILYQ